MKYLDGLYGLQQAVGTHLGYSEWHPITQEQIDRFADATGDHQWIHVDAERAKDGPFGGTIAHGYLTLSLVPMLTWQIYTVEGMQMGVNYGANKMRFPSPVPVGSAVRAGVELVSVSETASGYQMVTKVTIEHSGSSKPACVVEAVTMLVPAEASRPR
ncbi:MaoC family dehydratase [Nocardia sp. NPDC055053]